MNKDELYRILHEREKQIEAAKTKRSIITTAAFTLGYFLLLYWDKKPTGWEILANIVSALFMAGLHIVINTIVFEQLFSISEAERKELEAIRKRISEIEQQEFERKVSETKRNIMNR